ncbi:hypothetical protein, partial [Brucella thiophenivorans]|uniref:hypothetical protein n=1 Tax=Brucella thiophenivorans TaxID=571255 RepID=UPI001AEC899E
MNYLLDSPSFYPQPQFVHLKRTALRSDAGELNSQKTVDFLPLYFKADIAFESIALREVVEGCFDGTFSIEHVFVVGPGI